MDSEGLNIINLRYDTKHQLNKIRMTRHKTLQHKMANQWQAPQLHQGMKLFYLLLLSSWLLVSCEEGSTKPPPVSTPKESTFQNGDIIFQTSLSSQSLAIKKATNSAYSHIGVIYQKKDSSFHVFEAVQPIKLSPLQTWINRGEGKHFVVKRLKNHQTLLTTEKLKAMKSVGQKHLGKDYDLAFEWDDNKMYCSELVWKIYKEGVGIKLCPLQQLKDFDLSDEVVQNKLKQRYGKSIPLDNIMVSPQGIFDSDKLVQVMKQ